MIPNLEKYVLTEIMFKYAIKTEITRRYHERRLKKFFDFIEFEITYKNIFLKSCKVFH